MSKLKSIYVLLYMRVGVSQGLDESLIAAELVMRACCLWLHIDMV